RHSGQTDFLVGLPVAGRTEPRFRSVVGFFVNMVVLRARLRDSLTCRELIADVGRRVMGAIEHQDYPFARLVERLAPTRAAARVPFLQATIVLQKGQRNSQPLYAITQ